MSGTTRSTRNCLATITAAAGRALTDPELETIVETVHSRIQQQVAAGDSRFAAAARAGEQLAGEELLAAIVERRAAAINARVRAQLDASVTPGNEFAAIRSLLSGARRVFRGAAESIDAAQHALRDQLLGGMILDLRRRGVLEAVTHRDKAFERDLAVELWAVRDPASARPTGNQAAVDAAGIINRYTDQVRSWQNEAGAWIGRLENYIVRQSHDMMKIRAAGFDAWRAFIEPRLSPSTFEGRADRAQFLRNVYDGLASGEHDASTDATLAGFPGPGSLAKRVSQERLLHFGSADSWFDYNARFGKGGVMDAAIAAIDKGARDIALMRRLGTNPEAMFTAWTDRMAKAARDRNDYTALNQIRNAWHERTLDQLTGAAQIPGNATLARVGSMVRLMESLSKLGGVVLSSLPDLGVNAAMLRHNGIGVFESYAQQMAALIPGGAQRAEIAESLGLGLDHIIGHIMGRFGSEDGLPGRAAKAAQLFYKASGLTPWTEALKTAGGMMLSHNLARNAGRAWGDLPLHMRASLTRYGIEAGEWQQLAGTARRAADGRDYITPRDLADRALGDKVQAYISDQVREGMTEPTAYNRAVATMGTQRGTPAGELVRTLGQFKQYAVTYLDRSIGREFARAGPDVGGIAHLIVATTALGYLAMTLKELAKGRMPRDPTTPGAYKELLLAAMVQGGGLGIYGDFLFGDANRMGGGILATVAGPAAGGIEDAHKVLMDIIHHQGNAGADAIQFAKNNAPFINMFYSRLVLDHLIFYRIQEWANPGYLHRYEANVKRQNNQTFWLSPSTFSH